MSIKILLFTLTKTHLAEVARLQEKHQTTLGHLADLHNVEVANLQKDIERLTKELEKRAPVAAAPVKITAFDSLPLNEQEKAFTEADVRQRIALWTDSSNTPDHWGDEGVKLWDKEPV